MSFLGPVTTLDHHLGPPHDLEIEAHPFDEAYSGRIERFNRVGFEVRLDVRLTDDSEAAPVLVTVTRAEATAKALVLGVPVWIRPVAGASQVRITTPALTSTDPLDLPAASDPAPDPTFVGSGCSA
jgi:sulfate/thiosulfate transport system ATP-binding protein